MQDATLAFAANDYARAIDVIQRRGITVNGCFILGLDSDTAEVFESTRDFVLDTGATLTCVDQALAEQLGLPERTGQIGFGAGIGGSGSVRLVGLDSLRIGATKAYDLTACTLDLSQFEQAGLDIDGLLGLNFLKSFRVTLDFESNRLTLAEP